MTEESKYGFDFNGRRVLVVEDNEISFKLMLAVLSQVNVEVVHALNGRDAIEFCREHLAGYKKPTSVDFIDELPKNPNGKILRKDLKAPYWQGRERKIN